MGQGSRRLAALAVPLITLAALLGCTGSPNQAPVAVLDIFATSAASPWLDGLYSCAPASVAVRLADPEAADVVLRLGEPNHLLSPAFEVGTAEMLVAVHPGNGLGSLTLDQVRSLFAGRISNWSEIGGSNIPVLVWVYSAGEDVQTYFERTVMNGAPVASLARLAVSAQAMSDSIGSVPGSIGILPRRGKNGNSQVALALPSMPVLAIVNAEPEGNLREILSCMQSNSTAAP